MSDQDHDGLASQAVSRRDWLRLAAGGLAISGASGLLLPRRAIAAAPRSELIVRSSRPLDLETPVTAFTDWRTPNDLFFVRSHLGEPAIQLHPWTLEIQGEVKQPVRLSLDDLHKLPQVTVPAVLQCSGNGRGNFQPVVPGVGWGRGAVGNAEWRGVRVADLLERAGVRDGWQHLHSLGDDVPPNPKTPIYLRSIPKAKAIDPSTIIALTMNDEPLPWLHGGPLRLIVPGWTGNHWMKWLRKLDFSKVEAPGFYQQSGYKMPRKPAPPGAQLKPEDLESLTFMNVKSLIAAPATGTRARPGRIEVQGVAWTGQGFVNKVEVAIGKTGAWQPAQLQNDERPYTWRVWKYSWNAVKTGKYTIRARATDSLGQTQPDSTVWNRSGYLWNAIDSIEVEVG